MFPANRRRPNSMVRTGPAESAATGLRRWPSALDRLSYAVCRCGVCLTARSGLPGAIHGSVQISVLPFDPDVGFVDAVAFIGALQVSAAALVQFRPVSARCNWNG